MTLEILIKAAIFTGPPHGGPFFVIQSPHRHNSWYFFALRSLIPIA